MVRGLTPDRSARPSWVSPTDTRCARRRAPNVVASRGTDTPFPRKRHDALSRPTAECTTRPEDGRRTVNRREGCRRDRTQRGRARVRVRHESSHAALRLAGNAAHCAWCSDQPERTVASGTRRDDDADGACERGAESRRQVVKTRAGTRTINARPCPRSERSRLGRPVARRRGVVEPGRSRDADREQASGSLVPPGRDGQRRERGGERCRCVRRSRARDVARRLRRLW